MPIVDYFNENYEIIETDNYVCDKCYVRTDRSQPEKDFEKLLNKNNKVTWWFKNGTEKETCFAIEYKDPKTGISRAFYPDYLVYYSDKSVGIYDTKSGMTAEVEETRAKSNSKNIKLKGGIVQQTSSGMYVFEEENYDSDTSNKNWKRLDF